MFIHIFILYDILVFPLKQGYYFHSKLGKDVGCFPHSVAFVYETYLVYETHIL